MSGAQRDWRDVVADLDEIAREQTGVSDLALIEPDDRVPTILAEASELIGVLGPSMDERPRGQHLDSLGWATQADLVEYVRGCCSRAEYECEKIKSQRASRRHQLAVNIRSEISRIRFALTYADPEVKL